MRATVRLSSALATLENPFSARLPFCSLFSSPPFREKGGNEKEVVSQDNELRWDERWTRWENPSSRRSLHSLHKGAFGASAKRPIYLIVGNLHNGQLACHERTYPLLSASPNNWNYRSTYPQLYQRNEKFFHRSLLMPLIELYQKNGESSLF